MKKIAISLILLVAIFACKDAEQLLMPLIPDGESIPTRSLGDPFENGTLQNPNWKWQAEPPTWDIGETRDNHLFIEAEPNRNLWVSDATHLLYQETEADAFDVETKFTVRWDTLSGATGIVVKSPADNDWVTLKFWARGEAAKGSIQFQKKMRGMGLPDVQWRFGDWGEIDLSFRLKKEGHTYTAWYKAAEDTDWIDIGAAELKLTPPLWLGIYAGNGAGFDSMIVEFEYFKDNLNP